jgi:hypothetical protein
MSTLLGYGGVVIAFNLCVLVLDNKAQYTSAAAAAAAAVAASGATSFHVPKQSRNL